MNAKEKSKNNIMASKLTSKTRIMITNLRHNPFTGLFYYPISLTYHPSIRQFISCSNFLLIKDDPNIVYWDEDNFIKIGDFLENK